MRRCRHPDPEQVRQTVENLPRRVSAQASEITERTGPEDLKRLRRLRPSSLRVFVPTPLLLHQPERIVSVHGAAGGSQRKALARRRSAAALDRHRALGSREKVPTHQRLSRNLVAEGTLESVAPSAEGGPDSRSCLNLVVGRLTVPNIESRCNQLKLGHPLLQPT
jgi:hypothetical protein